MTTVPAMAADNARGPISKCKYLVQCTIIYTINTGQGARESDDFKF